MPSPQPDSCCADHASFAPWHPLAPSGAGLLLAGAPRGPGTFAGGAPEAADSEHEPNALRAPGLVPGGMADCRWRGEKKRLAASSTGSSVELDFFKTIKRKNHENE